MRSARKSWLPPKNESPRHLAGLVSNLFRNASLPVFCPTRQTDLELKRQPLHSGPNENRIQRENHSSVSLRGLPAPSTPKIGG